MRVRELYSRLTDSVDATVITGNFPGASDTVVAGVAYRRVGVAAPYWLSRLTYAAGANRLARMESGDALILDFSSYTPLLLPATRRVGVVVHHLSSPTGQARWGMIPTRGLARLERAMIGRASRISATSAVARESASALAPSTPVDMVSAGVDPALFRIVRKPANFLLYFGRLDLYHKGIDTLLHAIEIIARNDRSVDLRIAGRGSAAEEIKALAKSLGIERNLTVLGAVDEPTRRALLATAAMQVMPSRFEGFGLAAAEAMAAGVPLIASNAGSLPEVVDAPRGGILVPPDDPAALAEAITRLRGDASLKRSLQVSARESARRFDWDGVATDHLRFLHAVAGK